MLCDLSSLNKEKLEAIQSVEHKMGKTLLAYTCHEVAPAQLNEEELNQLKEAEKRLGIFLVAVRS